MMSRGGRGRDECRGNGGDDVRDVKAWKISQNSYVDVL
jgi:hypothetical protein